MGRQGFWKRLGGVVLGVLVLGGAGGGRAAAAGDGSILEMDLRELTEIRVTSVSRRPQKLSDTAAAVYVITSEDIRRSGATTLPEVLRMVPGVEVARINASTWAITTRGMNGRFSNKLLVLVDGRSVYTPLFSGVYWETQDIPLEDVDRIEVIRGPGASIWGANAVNGIINVITRSAREDRGWLVSGTGGTEERARTLVRYEGRLGRGIHGRVYAQYRLVDEGEEARGVGAEDGRRSLRGGLQMEWEGLGPNQWMLQTDAYNGHQEVAYVDATQRILGLEGAGLPVLEDDVKTRGGWVLTRWRHLFPGFSELTVQAYWDRTVRDEPLLTETRDTLDLDMQHVIRIGSHHDVVWGVGFRWTRDRLTSSPAVSFSEDREIDRLWSGFVQDELSLAGDALRLTLGAKMERNEYTGTEIQPTARAHFKVSDSFSLWGAVSRAVRTPSRAEDDGRILVGFLPPGGLALYSGGAVVNSEPAPMILRGREDFGREVLKAYEAGIRFLAGESLSLDAAVYYHDYDDLRTFEPRVDPAASTLWLEADNRMEGRAYGLEVSADWFPFDWWRVFAAYTWQILNLRLDNKSHDLFSEFEEGRSPRHRLSVRSAMDLGDDWELDVWCRYVSRLPQDDVDGYFEADVRLGWRPLEGWRVELVGQNLIHPSHLEFIPGKAIETVPSEVERGVYLRITVGR